MPSYPLDTSASVVLAGASPEGTVRLGPGKPFEVWHITNVAVSVSTANDEPIAKVFKGDVNAKNLIAGTYTGSNDSTEVDITLHPGQYISVKWFAGDAGATATASISGTFDYPK